MLVVVAVVAFAARPAFAAYGDSFGVASVNVAGAQDSPVFDGATAFWAGTCDRASAPVPPAVGDPAIPLSGGVGALPAQTPGSVAGALGAHPSPSSTEHCADFGTLRIPGGPVTWNVAPAWRLAPVTAAGGHGDGSATFYLTKDAGGKPDGAIDNIYAQLPPGFVGDPTAIPQCPAEAFARRPITCEPRTQVGVVRILLEGSISGNNYTAASLSEKISPVYNLAPRQGNTAELGIPYASGQTGDQGAGVTTVRLVARARTNGDFGVTTFVGQIPSALPLYSQAITLWGVPWEAANDIWRGAADIGNPLGHPCSGGGGHLPYSGLLSECQVPYDPSWGPVWPFISNPTECDGHPDLVRLAIDSYQHPGAFTAEGDPDLSDGDWKQADQLAPPITGCEKNPFDPVASFVPTSTASDAPSGLNVDITIPANDDPPLPLPALGASPAQVTQYVQATAAHWKSDAGLATSHLDRTVVPLPEGFTVNPSGAAGLEGCSDAQMGVTQVGNPYLFNNVEPSCPDGSRIGTAEATTPLLDEKLTGEFVLGQPKSTNPTSGEMLRVFLVVRNKDRGLLAKVHGFSVVDPATGRLTATFDKNPRVPVENIKVSLKGGERGLFAQAPTCGERITNAVFTPWTAAHGAGGVARTVSDSFTVGGDCSFGFAPGLVAGMDSPAARGGGTFSFRFTRAQGDQTLRGLTAKLPHGLLASVRGLPLCKDAQAAAGACPAASKIGIVDAKAGSGDPFVLERKGEVFLTEGYKGGEYGLMVKVRPIAGPFRGALELSPIIVRQAIHVDRRTAQVTAVSDPLPTIHHGVPLRIREVLVNVNRPDFMLNPSDCSAKQVGADILSAEGATATPVNHFQASGCRDLRFKPRLALALKGRRQVRTGKHPAVRAVVRQQGVSEAGIEKAVVRLPKSLALDPDNAQALCEFEDGTKPDLENHCPKGSIVGRARAKTPLLNDDLVGNVYFVKNVRIDPDTGNEIRTLPMIVVALRGEIAVNLVGESSTTRSGKLVNTFDEVPDAPITRFNLNIRGGKNGILAVTRTRRSRINLCARPNRHIAEADMDGQNGKRYDRNIRMKTPCRKRRPSAAKACRKRTETKQGFKRCVVKVKRNRAQQRRTAKKRKAAARRSNGGDSR